MTVIKIAAVCLALSGFLGLLVCAFFRAAGLNERNQQLRNQQSDRLGLIGEVEGLGSIHNGGV